MEPTLDREKCYLLVRVGLLFYPFALRRGDVVLSRNPRNADDQDVVKRIIGLEGDEVVQHPRGWISKSPHLLSTQTVRRGHVWLQGDNMNESCDSRTYGQVDSAKVYGKVVWQIYPCWKRVRNTMQYAAQDEEYHRIAKESPSKAMTVSHHSPKTPNPLCPVTDVDTSH